MELSETGFMIYFHECRQQITLLWPYFYPFNSTYLAIQVFFTTLGKFDFSDLKRKKMQQNSNEKISPPLFCRTCVMVWPVIEYAIDKFKSIMRHSTLYSVWKRIHEPISHLHDEAFLTKLVHSLLTGLIIFAKSYLTDFWQSPKFASAVEVQKHWTVYIAAYKYCIKVLWERELMAFIEPYNDFLMELICIFWKMFQNNLFF